MNVSAVGAAVLFASLAVTSANASVSSSKALGDLGASPSITHVDFVQGHESIAGLPARSALVRAEASRTAAAQYFDFDVIVTLGALAIASGAFVAAGIAGSRRRVASNTAVAGEGWRDEVMQALEVDLEHFTSGLRRAA
jgi:hypothetical protein